MSEEEQSTSYQDRLRRLKKFAELSGLQVEYDLLMEEVGKDTIAARALLNQDYVEAFHDLHELCDKHDVDLLLLLLLQWTSTMKDLLHYWCTQTAGQAKADSEIAAYERLAERLHLIFRNIPKNSQLVRETAAKFAEPR